MNKTITGLYKAPGKHLETRIVDNTLEALQQLVGGYIETVTIASDCLLICNEEGKRQGLPANFCFCGELFVGPVFICCRHGENFTDLKISEEARKHLKASIDGGDCFGRAYRMGGDRPWQKN